MVDLKVSTSVASKAV
jgi:uncharacterized protein YacL